ncbi:hypothetical protein BWQ96_10113 [Gracilariopsis chorda]|uniref:Uncharacterized protein n=1 Tax=Gracilariopsis chorda TaxID=448386 RepID=A0A2V3IDL1_9FLOR|nr:hypothetical protein BWQ96_10113 [Gracilariopsis chorda]|eukprot:PXF40175.1 hypothetical protein BWQ96_10113 [Gracilariopsis chorda]
MNSTKLVLVIVCFLSGLVGLRFHANAKEVFVHYLPWYDSKGLRYPLRTGWCYPDGGTYDCSDISVIHYSNEPLIGEYSQFDDEVLEYHLLTIYVAGIDGIIINVNPANSLQKEVSVRVMDKLVRMKNDFAAFNLKVIISYDDNGQSNQALITSYLQWVYDTFYSASSYASLLVKYLNQPIIITWSESDPQHYWSTLQSLFQGNVFVLVRNAVNFQYSDGNFEWVNNLNLGTPISNTQNWGQSYFADFNWISARQSEKGVAPQDVNLAKMGGVYPGFDDGNVPAFWNGGTNRYILRDVDDGETMTLTWEKQISYTPSQGSGLDSVENLWVQIATWNDWPEGTSIEPASAATYGYRALETCREKAAQFKNTAAPYGSACLRVPYHIYEMRRAGSTSAANNAIVQLLSVPQQVVQYPKNRPPSPSRIISANSSPSPEPSNSVIPIPLVSNAKSQTPSSSPSPGPVHSVISILSVSSAQSSTPSLSAEVPHGFSPAPSNSNLASDTPSSSPSVSSSFSSEPSLSSSPTASVSFSASNSPTPSSSASPSPALQCPCECSNLLESLDVGEFARNCRIRMLFRSNAFPLIELGDAQVLGLCQRQIAECTEKVKSPVVDGFPHNPLLDFDLSFGN